MHYPVHLTVVIEGREYSIVVIDKLRMTVNGRPVNPADPAEAGIRMMTRSLLERH